MKKMIFLLFLGSAIMGCKTMKPADDKDAMVLEGRISELGMSTFQYGTHLLEKGGKTYALRSSAVKLNDYVGKEVSIKGSRVEGYPLENGPELIDVKQITQK